jgi:hypothetical protein
MTDERLTDELAARVMGWKPAPDRFVKSGRCWIPRWRFQPLTSLEDAFQLLDRTAARYTLTSDSGATLTADIRIGGASGRASEELKPRAITMATARALGIEVDR